MTIPFVFHECIVRTLYFDLPVLYPRHYYLSVWRYSLAFSHRPRDAFATTPSEYGNISTLLPNYDVRHNTHIHVEPPSASFCEFRPMAAAR